MFPAYGLHDNKVSGNDNVPHSNAERGGGGGKFDWLINTSYKPQNVIEIPVTDEEVTDTSLTESILPEETNVPIGDDRPKVEKRHRKHKKEEKRKRRSLKSPAHDEPVRPAVVVNKKKVFIEEVGLAPEHAFRVDRSADRSNLVLSLPYQHIAIYRRMTTFLGDSLEHQECWNNFMYEKGYYNKDRHKRNLRYYKCMKILYDDKGIIDLSKFLLKSNKDENEKLLKSLYWPLVKTQGKVEETQDFSCHSVNPLGVYDQNTTLYFEGRGPVTTNVTVSESGREDSNYQETTEQYYARMTTEYNKYLRECPHDIAKWMEFVRFQDDAVEVGMSKTVGQRSIAEKVKLEKKIAILEKAIENNPKAMELLATKVELCAEVWDTDKLVSEWKRIIFVHPNSTWLWKKYLHFLQTRFSAFSVSKFGRLFTKCFDMLKKIHEGTFQSHRPLPYMEGHMLAIFDSYCHVLCESGCREKAIANFQALIEFNFFIPHSVVSQSAPLQNLLAFFEPFWDSGVPRFGEDGAKGWCNVMKDKTFTNLSSRFEDDKNEEDILNSSDPLWMNWQKLEESRESRHWLPWRASELEDECDDPDRSILFDDVSPSLFRLKEERSKFLLIIRFLGFLGVQAEPHMQSVCDYFECHEQSLITRESQVVGQRQQFQWKFYTSSGTDNSLDLSETTKLPSSSAYDEFVERVFHQSLKFFSGSYYRDLLSLWLQHKCRCVTSVKSRSSKLLKSCKKFVKGLLKCETNRNDLNLWSEYAKLEWMCGNIQEARKVIDVSLASQAKSDVEELRDVCYLYRSAVTMELGMESDLSVESICNGLMRAKSIIVQLVSKGTVPSLESSSEVTLPSILKARKSYEEMLAKLLKDYDSVESNDLEPHFGWQCGHLLTEWTICYALFEYVTDGLKSASLVFENVIQHFEKLLKDSKSSSDSIRSGNLRERFNCELLYMHYLKLQVYHNNCCVSSSIKMIRDVLDGALSLFPENRQFNRLFLDIEVKSHVAGRLRRYFDKYLKESSHPGCISAIHAIVSELERQNVLLKSHADFNLEVLSPSVGLETGVTHRLRALFEKVLGCSSLQSCVLLWRLYLKFEVMQGNLKEGKAIYYRALQRCPWAKVLYFDAVQYFPEDLHEINDIMIEKEIRVRTPLEELNVLLGIDVSSRVAEDNTVST